VAINPKDLEHLKPSSGAERLKARKNRIKPWQVDASVTVDTSSEQDEQPVPDQTPASKLESSAIVSENQMFHDEHPASNIEAAEAPPLNEHPPLPVHTHIFEPVPLKSSLLSSESKDQQNQVTIEEQSGNNQGTIGEQPSTKVPKNRVTIREQSGNKSITKKPQSGNGTGNDQGTIRERSDNNQVTNLEFEVLRGKQRQLLHLIYGLCRKSGSLETPQLGIQHLAQCLETDAGSAKTHLNRLVKKGFVRRKKGSSGPGGWSVFALDQGLYQKLALFESNNNQVTIREQSDNNQGTQQVTRRVTASSSSSSDLYSLDPTTTTSEQPGADWSVVGWDVLRPYGFTETHLKQIIGSKCTTPQSLARSVEAFEFDIRQNKKKFVKGPIPAFMGIVRKGGEYAPPANFESEEDRLLRENHERLKAHQQRRQALLTETRAMAFHDWKSSLSESELKNILPPNGIFGPGTEAERQHLLAYFDLHFWSNGSKIQS
jgi:hypothetical protein